MKKHDTTRTTICIRQSEKKQEEPPYTNTIVSYPIDSGNDDRKIPPMEQPGVELW